VFVQAAIEARAVAVRTRAGEVAVRDISLTVSQGELVAITGGGLGKSTLLDALSGLLPPSSGAVVRGPGRGQGARPASQSGYIPADDLLHPVLPLDAALRYAAAIRAAADPGAVGEALSAAGLSSSAALSVGALDPGQRKRAAIAAELVSRPAELFLDEPTAGLDPAQAAEVLRMLRRLADGGVTVVLTTSSPLDAARCDKVAVLASGGHLAFFGTPDAACAYFGVDSLEEIYERLAGVGDPAAAWARRFFHVSRARSGLASVPTTPPAPGPAFLVPDSAGPHSAGRVTVPGDWPGPESADPPAGASRLALADPHGAAGAEAAGRRAAPAAAVRQLPVLVRRNAEIVRLSPPAQAVLVAAPAAVLLGFAVLIGAGAFNGPGAGRAWPVLGGFCIGLAYGLFQPAGEAGVLRAERFGGLSATAYVVARLALLLPAVAVAGATALAVPAGFGRLPHGYGPGYLTLLLSGAVALAFALLLSAVAPPPASSRLSPTVLWLPAVLLVGVVLTLLDRPAWPDWVVLAALGVALAAAATVLIARRVPASSRVRPSARF
jgi:ABC-type multidrug transport system ATPase subunit